MMGLQLITGGYVSQPLGLKSVGLDWKEEARRMQQEQQYEANTKSALESQVCNLVLTDPEPSTVFGKLQKLTNPCNEVALPPAAPATPRRTTYTSAKALLKR